MEKTILGIASALKLDAAEFTAALKDGDKWIADEAMAEKISEVLSERFAAATSTNRKAGQKEINDKIKRFVKRQGFEIPEGLQGEELLSAYNEWKEEELSKVGSDGKTPGEMSKEELSKLPIVRSLIKEREDFVQKKFEADKADLEKRVEIAEMTRKRTLVNKTMAKLLDDAKINLGDDPATREARIALIEARIPYGKIKTTDDDNVQMLDDDGFDADFKSFVLGIATPSFGIVKQDPKKGGANPTQGGAAGAAGNGEYVPKYTFAQQKDFDTAYGAAADNAERFQMLKDWRHQQEAAAGK